MDDTPVVLGINRTREPSICLMQGSHLAWAIQKERLTRRRHHWGKPGDLRDHYLPRLPGLDRPVDILVECFSSDDEAGLPLYEDELAATALLSRGAQRARISHHLAHLYSVFHPSPVDDAAVMVIGGQGSPVAALTEAWSGAAHVPGDWREVASFYAASRSQVGCIGKQVWDRGDARLVGLGMFYFLLTQALFPGEGNEGKVMGLAPYGDAAALGLPALEVEGMAVGIPQAWRSLLRERDRFRMGSAQARFTDCANLAAAGQRAFEDALLALARWLHRHTGAEHLCFAGSAALNAAANGRLLRETPFSRVFLPPAPGDAGAALGCAMYGLTELAGRRCEFRWSGDYLGPPPQLSDIEAALQDVGDFIVEQPRGRDALCARMLDLLCTGRVVGLYQGRSEFGPRALGHRSILADPRRDRMRDWINARVKGRDWFRPFAPVVPEERATVYFDLAGASPFMQFAAKARPEIAPMLPAVTHVDGSVRLQTVGPGGNPLLRALLAGFEVRTGVAVLLNTSFKPRDEPMVETPFEAVAAFRHMPLHALAMPPFLVTKRQEPELPA